MRLNLQKNLLIGFCGVILIMYLFSVGFYPRTRDEFYYLSGETNVFSEYINSYFYVNARIGQFFSNLSGRYFLFKFLMSGFLFLSFLYLLFLFVFRVSFSTNINNLKKLLLILGIFIFLINYFGEMFFYVPYSANYTLMNVFYLIYIYIITGYFIYNKNYLFERRIPILVIILFGVFTGMGNEHVPPAILLLTGVFFLSLLIKSKRIIFPSKEIIYAFVSVLVGYLMLFFAPANRVRMHKEGKDDFGFSIMEYLGNLKNISKLYYYCNFELLIFLGFIIVFFLIYSRKKMTRNLSLEIASYLFLVIVSILIAAYSPIIGTRLLFFSNVLLIISGLIILFRNNECFFHNRKIFNVVFIFSMIYISFYFITALVITFNAHSNYNMIMNEIELKSRSSKDVNIEKSFDYKTDFFGNFNRKILLDTGESYIDKDSENNTSMEMNIIDFYKINSVRSEK